MYELSWVVPHRKRHWFPCTNEEAEASRVDEMCSSHTAEWPAKPPWQPGSEGQIHFRFVLLTIKMGCLLHTLCTNALVCAGLLLGSLSIPSPTAPRPVAEPADIVLGGRISGCESSLKVLFSLRKGYNLVNFLILFTVRVFLFFRQHMVSRPLCIQT